jgi:hypothetical protein
MTDILDKAIDLAKKLRKTAKKSTDPTLQALITDLNLCLADLKVQVVEARQADLPAEPAGARAGSEPKTAATPPMTLGTAMSSSLPDSMRRFPS